MKKVFVLDTNVLLHDPNSLFSFADNEVVLPIVVIEEIDEMKRRQDEVGRNSRVASHLLDDLRSDENQLSGKGVPLKNGGILRIDLIHQDLSALPKMLQKETPDNRIIAVAKRIQDEEKAKVVLVSKDINMRIKADALGLKAEDYEKNKVKIDELYTGAKDITVSGAEIDKFYADKMAPYKEEWELTENQCVMFVNNENDKNTALGIYDKKQSAVKPLLWQDKKIWGIKARNKEQRYAFELLMDENIKLITLVGIAGTGKTLLALAAGLNCVLEEQKFKKLLVSRPIIPMGKDIGFLPGDVVEKLMPRMQAIQDNLEYLFSQVHGQYAGEDELNGLIENGVVELEPLTYIRGRSIPDVFIIVDEAQNLSPHEIKTIITRAGTNTKIVLTGDPYQIDHPYLDANSNGLTYMVERFKGQETFGHITFTKGERSPLAELAANLM